MIKKYAALRAKLKEEGGLDGLQALQRTVAQLAG